MPDHLLFRRNLPWETRLAALRDPTLPEFDPTAEGVGNLPDQEADYEFNPLSEEDLKKLAEEDDDKNVIENEYVNQSIYHDMQYPSIPGYKEDQGSHHASPTQPWVYKMPHAPPVTSTKFYQAKDHLILICHRPPEIPELLRCVGPDRIFPVLLPFFDWEYENRRTAQEILPFLYLGSLAAAKDAGAIEKEGITLLLAVREPTGFYSQILSKGNLHPSLSHVKYASLEVQSSGNYVDSLQRGIRIINAHLSSLRAMKAGVDERVSPGKVLVYCESGNNRSAMLVMAYIMTMYGIAVQDAYGFVQHRRFSVNLQDEAQGAALQAFEVFLQAKYDIRGTKWVNWEPKPVEAALKEGLGWYPEFEATRKAESYATGTLEQPVERTSHKRTLSTVYKTSDSPDDMEMDEAGPGDDSRFVGRAGKAPFALDS
ncbi:MAG: hypothetical protein M1814_002794 [Vezdaea aestivalis]|nr:MAG: hypothetical protein M1814_002794 [Vezdaea aestivalis]